MLATLLSQHISVNVNDALIAKLVVRYEGDLNRRLTLEFASQRRLTLALQFGKRALATRFSWKWAGYLLYLKAKTWLARPDP